MPVQIRCPHCNFAMELKGVKPGRFHPRCTSCKGKFLLQIFPESDRAPLVAVEHDPKAETISPVVAYALGVEQNAATPGLPAPSAVKTIAPAALAQYTPVQETPPDEPHVETHASAPASEVVYDDFDAHLIGGALGGYQVISKLGAGGMGAVYLARQISLDRNVALKILSPGLASDPQFVARFTREAYAAAQLTHHNVVQIHDIGAEHDLHFFSMEFVEGQTLAKLVEENKKVDADQAVGFVLQAARGLKYAHDHGLIHRDIKPENLMLNDQGIVKVADLGLVKRAGTNDTLVTGVQSGSGSIDKTEANMSMGTPAYMSPEQSVDAAKVDLRADIYSLGCTLYDLLTGRPPFVGRTAMEVITKHQREQVVPPDMVVKDVPKSLSAILMKMVAKKPEQRYQSMDEVIKALEDFLGVATAGPFTPKEEHVKILQFAVERFNRTKWMMIRKLMIGVFFLLCAAMAVFVGATRPTISDKIRWTGGFVGLAVLTSLSYFLITGITQRTHLFLKFRQLAFGANLADWIMWVLALGAVFGVLYVFEQIVPWLIVVGIAILLASAFHWTIDLMLSRDRRTPFEQTEAMLKTMRLRGLDENALRMFVCKYSGKHWEAFYETLFGYEAKMQARHLWGRADGARHRPKFAAWRDPIVRAIEMRLAMRREFRERQILARVEAKALRAKGIRDDLARKQARNNARALVSRAEKLRSTSAMRAARTMTPPPVGQVMPQSVVVNRDVALEGAIAAILRGASMEQAGVTQGKHPGEEDEDYERLHESWFKRRYGTPIDLLCSQMVRVILAVIVLATFTLWFQQNSQRARQEAIDLANRRRTFDVTAQVSDLKGQIVDGAQDVKDTGERIVANTGNKPLQLFPEAWDTMNACAAAFGGWNAGLAGLLLLLSAFFTGRIMTLFVLLAAAVAMSGHRIGIALPVVGEVTAWMTAAAGTMIWIFGVMFFRDREGY